VFYHKFVVLKKINMPAPLLIPLAAAALPTVVQGLTAIGQKRKSEEMARNLGPRVNYQIPEEAKKALALYENMAVSRTMPGQQLMQNMIDLEQSKALGQMSRVGNAQDAAGIIQGLGQRGMELQQNLGLQASENYTERQQDLAGAYGAMAGYQEKVIADQQQNWYEESAARERMENAWRENLMGAAQNIGQVGLLAAMGKFDQNREVKPRDPIGDLPYIQSKSITQLPRVDLDRGLMGRDGKPIPRSSSSLPAGQLPVGGLAPMGSSLADMLAAQKNIDAQNKRESGWQSFNNQYFMNPLFQ
jgi:hypothetical protein